MIERIAGRYRGRWLRGYAKGKLRGDPAYAAAFACLQDVPLPVLDVGCGIGLLEFYLRERGFAAPLTGFDFDEGKVAEAQRVAAHYREVSFAVSDARAFPAAAPGHVVIFDVLHYLPAAAQRDLLARAAERVAPGGVCLIREAPRDGSWRQRFTEIEEAFIHAILWMKSRAVYFPSVAEIVAPFKERGFSAEIHPLWGGTPFNSHLFILRAPNGRAR